MNQIAKTLKERFPWLGTDEEHISGSEVIEELGNLYDYEVNKLETLFVDNLIIDWVLFRKQKQVLAQPNNFTEIAEGILNLMDHIQDYVVDSGQLKEAIVFGFPTIESNKEVQELPNIEIGSGRFWQVGCSQCDTKVGEWTIYADGKNGFIAKCVHCGYICKFPPDELKSAPEPSVITNTNSQDISVECSICGNSSGFDEESLKASTYEINGTKIVMCCPCEDDLKLTLFKLANIPVKIGDGGEVIPLRDEAFIRWIMREVEVAKSQAKASRTTEVSGLWESRGTALLSAKNFFISMSEITKELLDSASSIEEE